MTIDVILYWIAFSVVCIGILATFTRWWDYGYMFLAIGMFVLGAACLFRGYWPEDAAIAALSYVSGLGIIYIAFRKGVRDAREQIQQRQGDGVVPEGSGDSAQ